MAETGRDPVSASPSWSWWPVVPAALAALVAAVLQLAGPRVSLVFALRPAFLVLLVGVVASATWVVLARVRTHAATRRRAELEAAVARTRSDARDDHRRFLSRLDHELKNPVTAIRAALAAHGSGGADHLRTADEQATRLAAVVTDLRKLAELQTSELEVEPVDLTALVEEAVTALRGEISVLGSGATSACSSPRPRGRCRRSPATPTCSTSPSTTSSPTPASSPPTATSSRCAPPRPTASSRSTWPTPAGASPTRSSEGSGTSCRGRPTRVPCPARASG
ncbi:HAMP domain-containing histidine kinase [Phycicoccus sp. HDW14]|nr:HAMP domain-containing histidine kinase [Phycicoccus sp. HDW14]